MEKEWIPFAVSIGIEIDDFYRMNPKKMMRRIPFYEEKINHARKVKQNEMNLDSWLKGLYVARAIAGLSGKAYPQEPTDIFMDSNMSYESVDGQQENQTQEEKAADGFRAYAFIFNRERKKKNRREVKDDGER